MKKHAKLRALVVDDAEISRRIVCRISCNAFEHEQAENGLVAFEKYRQAVEMGKPFDIVFMDVIMPEMDGKESVRRIRQYEESIAMPNVPIIMVTASEMIDEIEKLVHGLLRKVINKPQLEQMLQNLFPGRIAPL